MSTDHDDSRTTEARPGYALHRQHRTRQRGRSQHLGLRRRTRQLLRPTVAQPRRHRRTRHLAQRCRCPLSVARPRRARRGRGHRLRPGQRGPRPRHRRAGRKYPTDPADHPRTRGPAGPGIGDLRGRSGGRLRLGPVRQRYRTRVRAAVERPAAHTPTSRRRTPPDHRTGLSAARARSRAFVGGADEALTWLLTTE
jgi:hypothetical protein